MDRPGLNAAQNQAVHHQGGPLLVLAGAGTGKTRVLTERIAFLIQSRAAHPSQILAVTFTNKAAREMRERLERTCGPDARSLWVGTFHAICARLLRRHGVEIGIDPRFVIIDDDDQLRIMNGLLKDHHKKDEVSAKSLLSLIDRAKNCGKDPVAAAAHSPMGLHLAQIYPIYAQRLFRENALDFNDILLRVLELFAVPALCDLLQRQFTHVLVDEFQDTNRVQYNIVKSLAGEHGQLTVVGDDDQSIYSWRGAEPRNILDFHRDYPNAEVVRLEDNYRSHANILDAANAVIAHNRDRHGKNLRTTRGTGQPLEWFEAWDDREEAGFIASRITRSDDGRAGAWSKFAILYRTHAQSRLIEEQLRRARIPYRIYGGMAFFQRKEVKDVAAYLRLLMNPAMDHAFERIINVPARGIGAVTVQRLGAVATERGISRLAAARLLCEEASGSTRGAMHKLRGFVQLFDSLQPLVEGASSIAELIIQVVERSGYRAKLEAEGTDEARDRLNNLAELVSVASDFDDETGGQGTLAEFDERLALASALDAESDAQQAHVQLMTIHAAKGLEFPHVLLSGMEEGVFPSHRDRGAGGWESENDGAMEEERRLAYVAMTRAMDTLTFTNAKSRRVWGEYRANPPSRFLLEVPPHLFGGGRNRSGASESSASLQSEDGVDFDDPIVAADEFFSDSPWQDDVPVFQASADVGHTRRQPGPVLARGHRVNHQTFGTGKIIDVMGEGTTLKALVNFDAAGMKTVLARFLT